MATELLLARECPRCASSVDVTVFQHGDWEEWTCPECGQEVRTDGIK